MQFTPPLTPARLIKRYKRFLADVTLDDGTELTVHCPNTGSMKACWEPGWQVYLQDSNNPKRKYPHTWVIVENTDGERIGINTHLANQLVEDAIRQGVIKELADFESLRREVKYGDENSRIDFLLETSDLPVYIEVKSVTLKEEDGLGYFPDAQTTRGQKHLRELMALAQSQQARAVLLFCVQHTGITSVAAARHIDPAYAELLDDAIKAGVEVLAYGTDITPQEIRLTQKLTLR
jgi:sugar fermentation stimulation protein A